MTKTAKRQNPRLKNENTVVIGFSGSGKTSWIRQKTASINPARIVAWDPDEDYKLPRARTMAGFKKFLQKAGYGPIRCALTVDPTPENFEEWARLVFCVAHCKAPMVVIAEEIADVTRIGKASPNWGQLCRKGRKYGVRLFAVSQRPQECDKTVFTQSRFKWCGILGSEDDRKYMSKVIDVPLSELSELRELEYFYRAGAETAEKNVIQFTK